MSEFIGKVAIVTGGTSGIGRATAIAYAREGAKVVVAGRRETRGYGDRSMANAKANPLFAIPLATPDRFHAKASGVARVNRNRMVTDITRIEAMRIADARITRDAGELAGQVTRCH